MEFTESPEKRAKEYGIARNSEAPVFMFIRLWTYGGTAQPLNRLTLEREPEIAELIGSVIRQGRGVILEPQRHDLVSALFNEALTAVSAAKGLQQQFLSYHRKAEPHQIVPCVLIAGVKDSASSAADDGDVVPEHMGNVNSARILVCQSIYEQVKGAPGVQFDPQAVREAGQTGDPEAIYELLWTDESTYGHLRTAARSHFNTVGRYQVQGELGRGGMGAVYKAHDPLIGRTVALKILSIDRNTPDRDQVIERLKQEAKAAGKLDHPNIITIYDVGEESDLVYLSMQFLEGKTLQRLLAEDGVPQLSTLISWADQICSAVGYAHAHGVVHRDLKPANLMLSNQGVVKILDFGIAKVEDATLTATGMVVGTPSHMAPEQVAGKKVDQRTDIFSLGSVFYELVTREKPFRGDVATILYKIVNEDPIAPSLINPALPGGIDAIIRKALAKDPKDRFQNCDEMRKAFLEQAAFSGIKATASPVAEASEAKPAPPSPATFSLHLLEDTAPKRPRRRSPVLAGIAALALIAAASWVFVTARHNGSLPAITNRVTASVDHISQQVSSRLKHSGNSSQHADAQLSNDGPQNTGSAASSSGMTTSAAPNGDNATQAQASAIPANPGTPAGTPEKPASLQLVNQPLSTAATAPTSGKTMSAEDPSQANSATNSAEPSLGTTPSGVTAQKNGGQSTEETPRNPLVPSSAADNSAKAAVDSGGEPGQTTESETPATSAKKAHREPPQAIDGFTRRDVPELLRQADAAEGRGDYPLARYSYNLILKLDPGNAAARSGLRRLQQSR